MLTTKEVEALLKALGQRLKPRLAARPILAPPGWTTGPAPRLPPKPLPEQQSWDI